MRRLFLVLLTLAVFTGGAGTVLAADLPSAATSSLAGVSFDDPPIALPVAQNFQIAMQTAARELGMSCRNIEAFGWKMKETEQSRVEAIFSTTVGRLRAMGYRIDARRTSSVASDITVFTAYKTDKELLTMWSAGELGLVLLICDAPPTPDHGAHVGFMSPKGKPSGRTLAPVANFTPVGVWQGSFTCARGISGGTLKITRAQGGQIEGVFQFYPTRRNTDIPNGGYYVSGIYDPREHQTLLTPGNWIKRPRDFEAATIRGRFDPAKGLFSGVFQDVLGCTSFEARRVGKAESTLVRKKKAVKVDKPVEDHTAPAPATTSPEHEVTPSAAAPLPPVTQEKPVEPEPAAALPAVPPKQDTPARKPAAPASKATPKALAPAAPPAALKDAPPPDALPAVPPLVPKSDSAPPPKTEAAKPAPRTNALMPPDTLGAPPPLVEQPPAVIPSPFPVINAPPISAPPANLPDPPPLQ